VRWSFVEADEDNPGQTRRKFQKQRFRYKADALAKAREIDDRKAKGLSVDHSAGNESLKAWANRWHENYVPPSSRTQRERRGSRSIRQSSPIWGTCPSGK
jgi:hypothetical protein